MNHVMTHVLPLLGVTENKRQRQGAMETVAGILDKTFTWNLVKIIFLFFVLKIKVMQH